jgi:hypothetical protein
MNKEKSFVVFILHFTFFANPQPCFLDPPPAVSLQPNGQDDGFLPGDRRHGPSHSLIVLLDYDLIFQVTSPLGGRDPDTNKDCYHSDD